MPILTKDEKEVASMMIDFVLATVMCICTLIVSFLALPSTAANNCNNGNEQFTSCRITIALEDLVKIVNRIIFTVHC
jgi:hypothetical protein